MHNRYLPSVGYLLAFEAAARHLSFTRTAMELNITQTAVSHRIKALEEFVGARLFDRDTTSIRLTQWGHEYLETVREALASISIATSRIIDGQNENSLSIATHVNFGLNYLIPLLPAFRRAFPHVALRLATIPSFDDLERHDYDVGIRYGTGQWRGFISLLRLGDDESFPVCSPALLSAGACLKKPKDLESYAIIRTASQILGDDWPQWLEAANAKDVTLHNGIVCNQLYATVQAAIQGLGVAMGRTSVVSKEIEAGTLIAPFDIRLPLTTSSYVVSTPDKAVRPVVQHFTNWLTEQLGPFQMVNSV